MRQQQECYGTTYTNWRDHWSSWVPVRMVLGRNRKENWFFFEVCSRRTWQCWWKMFRSNQLFKQVYDHGFSVLWNCRASFYVSNQRVFVKVDFYLWHLIFADFKNFFDHLYLHATTFKSWKMSSSLVVLNKEVFSLKNSLQTFYSFYFSFFFASLALYWHYKKKFFKLFKTEINRPLHNARNISKSKRAR